MNALLDKVEDDEVDMETYGELTKMFAASGGDDLMALPEGNLTDAQAEHALEDLHAQALLRKHQKHVVIGQNSKTTTW